MVAKFRSIFAVSGVAPGDQIVWEAQPGSDSSTAHPSYPDAEQFFNELNIAVENRAKPLAESLAFAPPTKGEFEKTADYELRLQQAHDAYDANQAKAAEHVGQQKFLSRYTTFNEFLGRPTISASRYDADSEKLTLTISSPNSPYSATAVFSLPPSAAQVVKPALEKISPHVLLGLRDGELTARVFALRVGDEVYSGPISEASNSPIRFGSAAAEQWPKTLAERAQERQQKENLRRQQEAAEIRREAATNPRLAYALNFPLADDPRCHALWSNAISFARLPSASEADWNRLTDKLMTGLSAMGCLPNH